MQEVSDWIMDLKVWAVKQLGCWAFEMYEKVGALGGTWTAWNNACKALAGQRSKFGIQEIGTPKAVSLDCLVLVHVTVIAAPQDTKVMLLRDEVEKEEKVSLDGGHKLAVPKMWRSQLAELPIGQGRQRSWNPGANGILEACLVW